MRELFGLPAHPLLVHAPVVLMPMLFLLIVVVAARPAWRDRLGWWVIAATAVTLVATLFAQSSGEELKGELVDAGIIAESTIGRHADLGEQAPLTLVVVLIVVVGWHLFEWWRARRAADGQLPGWVPATSLVLRVASVAAAGFALAWMIRTGHSGAEVVWDGVLE